MDQPTRQPHSKHSPALFDLSGKVAMVTGATGKLGRETAYALAQAGANLVIVARTESDLQSLKTDLERDTGRRILPVGADVHQEELIQAMFVETERHFGKVDILVNNVTGNIPDAVEQMHSTAWDTTMHAIVTSMFMCSKAAAALMSRHGSGSIINISSIYGMVAADQRIYGDSGLNSSVVYGTGKGAVIQMTRYLAAYWAKNGIRVNCISPGGVEDTGNAHPTFRANYEGRTPMGRMMRRDEIRGAVVFLASDAASYVTGHNLVLDGGFTIV